MSAAPEQFPGLGPTWPARALTYAQDNAALLAALVSVEAELAALKDREGRAPISPAELHELRAKASGNERAREAVREYRDALAALLGLEGRDDLDALDLIGMVPAAIDQLAKDTMERLALKAQVADLEASCRRLREIERGRWTEGEEATPAPPLLKPPHPNSVIGYVDPASITRHDDGSVSATVTRRTFSKTCKAKGCGAAYESTKRNAVFCPTCEAKQAQKNAAKVAVPIPPEEPEAPAKPAPAIKVNPKTRMVDTRKPEARQRIACITCQHGKRNEHSESGWECRAEIYRECLPWTLANKHQPKEAI